MTRRTVHGPAPVLLASVALLAAIALTGCSSGSGGGTEAGPKPGGEVAAKGSEAAAKGGTVGGSGSGCELPVVFDLAQRWKAKAVVPDEPGSEFAALSRQGPVAMVCEIDAKPAGHIGFLRVWQGDGKSGTPRQALEGFVKADENASKITYTTSTAGKLSVAEARYTVHSKVMDESRPARAFAVATPDGPVVVHLGGLDAQEHAGMLPAFELAKRSVRLG